MNTIDAQERTTIVPVFFRGGRESDAEEDQLAFLLSRALGDDPQFKYLVADAEQRHRRVHRLFTSALSIGQQSQTLLAIQNTDGTKTGAALWVRPGSSGSLGHSLTTFFPDESDGSESRKRSITLGRYLEEVRQRLAPALHWYLFAAAVNLSAGAQDVEVLLGSQLAQADAERFACYVETFNSRHLCLYERLGFRIVGSGQVPEDGPDFWTLLRPRRESRHLFGKTLC